MRLGPGRESDGQRMSGPGAFPAGLPREGGSAGAWGVLSGRRAPQEDDRTGIRYNEAGRGSAARPGTLSERAGPLYRTGGAASPAGGGDQPAGLAAPGRLGRALALPDPGTVRGSPPDSAPYPDAS
jgi:hypothetical protein